MEPAPFPTEAMDVDPKGVYSSRRQLSGEYRPVGVAEDVRSGQQQVVYRRVDTGQLLVCPLIFWHDNFAKKESMVEPQQPAASPS